ncbi:MAG: adenine deaminase [Chloroflexi bacterium]|nr:MAG: adenine deaminase [Chloroflexota bacterium]
MSGPIQRISGNIVDVLHSTIYPGTIEVREGRIASIERDRKSYQTFILPGLIDAHVHIESSMLVPSEFARLAVAHGTVATVSDPHEIANVLGIDGVNYMIENGKTTPLKFYFGAPSCVPATPFETSGARIGPEEVDVLLKSPDIHYLAEMMNFPGVINGDPEVMAKIALAAKYGKPVDGHAPGLKGADLERYVAAGISTDHETLTREEALEKIGLGMKIMIREGSAAKDFDTFVGLIEEYPDQCMFCSDDRHPDDLVAGHINDLVRRALARGIDRMKVLRCACVNPVRHYRLDVGLLQEGCHADFIEVDSFEDFNVLRTFIDDRVVAEGGRTLLPHGAARLVNNFKARKKRASDFAVKVEGDSLRVIQALDGQLFTDSLSLPPKVSAGNVIADTERDVLKITVVNRYQDAPPAVGFVRGFGLRRGAVASSVAHDSHNIIAVGVTDDDICRAVNLVIEHRGGMAAVSEDMHSILPLPIAGIMTDQDGFEVARRYSELTRLARQLGSTLAAPFMTLSFMALPVIPRLKLTDKGLFDGDRFEFARLFL